MKKFAVETHMSYGWEDVWTEDNEPLRFATPEAAEAAVQEFLKDTAEAGLDYVRDDFRIVEAEAA